MSGKTVRRLMAEEGCRVSYAKKRRSYSSYAGEIEARPPTTSSRATSTPRPRTRSWLTDITQFSIPAGKVYLSPVIDCFDGMPVAWSIGESPNAELANSMLEEACGSWRTESIPYATATEAATTDGPEMESASAQSAASSGRCPGRGARPTTPLARDSSEG